ncbi:MAG TPA: hypothetical protein VHD87_02720 [Acidimicrobiales bacterium]|nr:hypothetical protein [Acidimicrobiales bacterium]
MKRWLVILLIAVVVLTGLPVLMPGMMGVACAACGPARIANGGDCAAVLAAAALALAVLVTLLRRRRVLSTAVLFAHALDPPPRLTFG